MSWHRKAKKDVAGCDKPRGAASKRRSEDFRMGKPVQVNAWSLHGEYIAMQGAPGEVKHLSTRRKRNQLRLPE